LNLNFAPRRSGGEENREADAQISASWFIYLDFDFDSDHQVLGATFLAENRRR
jgi:hypothetical protein